MSAPNDTQPNTPDEWRTQYADLEQVKQVPATWSEDRNETGDEEIYRNIYLDGTPVFQHPLGTCEVYADILAFTEPEVALDARKDTTIEVKARVITSNKPLHLNITAAAAKSFAMVIYVSVVNQPVSVSLEGNQRTTLDLGADSSNLGVAISLTDGKLTVDPLEEYGDDRTPVYQAYLDTQLRVALALFWAKPAIALSICGDVARATSGPASGHALSNAQAEAMGQQLSARRMAGTNTHYAPSLNFETYHGTMVDQLNAARTFEEEYQKFQQAKNEVNDHKEAWEAMLKNAEDQRVNRASVQEQTLAKYKDASTTVEKCTREVADDKHELEKANEKFQEGLDAWENAHILQAVFGILKAVFGFAVGVAAVCMEENPLEGMEMVIDAINTVKEVEEAQEGAQEAGQIVNSEKMGQLWECVHALDELYPRINALVDAAQMLHDIPDGDYVDLPSSGKVTGSQGADADANLIVSIAAWDDWELQSDEQMRWAVEEEDIDGAGEYRLALRKHAVHGRALAQTQAEAIRQGQQYVQVTLEVHQLDKDIQNLQDLLDKYEGDEADYAAAEAKFYDRYLRLQTSLAIQLQYIVDAYRFITLEESQVTVDSQQSVGGFQKSLATLKGEMDNLNGRYGQDPQRQFYSHFLSNANQLASNFPTMLINGLKNSDRGHSATFSLRPMPQGMTQAGANNFAYPFVHGSQYRLHGMRITPQNIKPRSTDDHGRASVSILIETSGLYSDICRDPDGNKPDQVLTFVTQAQKKRYSYFVDENGEFLELLEEPSFPSTYHAEPPPFTEWKVFFDTADNFILDDLNSLLLSWQGTFRA